MGGACKIIINEMTRALSEALERILLADYVRDRLMPAGRCDELLQMLVEAELGFYQGTPVAAGLSPAQIVAELVERGVVTEEVWRVLAKPEGAA